VRFRQLDAFLISFWKKEIGTKDSVFVGQKGLVGRVLQMPNARVSLISREAKLLERAVLLGYGGRIASMLSRREAPNMSSHTDEHAAEVFPWMEHTIVVGALVGAVVAVGLWRASHLEPSVVVVVGLFGATAGAAVGVCLALLWAVEAPAGPARPSDLWDPWLDAAVSAFGADPQPTYPSEEVGFEIAARVNRARARVKPRVIAAETGEALPLEDVIGPILTGAESGAIRISGRPGSGKRLRWLTSAASFRRT
jgi:hypothetical protein